MPADLPPDIKDWDEYPSCHVLPPCEVKLANAVMEYDLYTAPKVPGIYAISHYRVRPTAATGMFKDIKNYHALEIVFWFPKPGSRPPVPQRIFIRRGSGWEEFPFKSAEWSLETVIVNRLWRVHADALDAEETLPTTVF